MTHNHFPRGKGTYFARLEQRCVEHGSHELLYTSDDDLAWEMCQIAALQLQAAGCTGLRVLLWFRQQPPHRKPPRPEPTGPEIEDDIPF